MKGWCLVLADMFLDADRERYDHVIRAMLKMQKLDIAALNRAYAREVRSGTCV